MYLGLRNIVMSNTDPPHWKYLLLYEIDGLDHLGVQEVYDKLDTSYIIYSTKNGYHFLGVTPLPALAWGSYFQMLHNRFGEFFSGQTLRFSAKPNEKRELISFSFRKPYIEKLVRKYAEFLSIHDNELPIFGQPPQYSIVMEKYYSEKD